MSFERPCNLDYFLGNNIVLEQHRKVTTTNKDFRYYDTDIKSLHTALCCHSTGKFLHSCRYSRSLVFNPFVPSAVFFYPLKTSENLTVF